MVKKMLEWIGVILISGGMGWGFTSWLISLDDRQPRVYRDDKTHEVVMVKYPRLSEDGYDVVKTNEVPKGGYTSEWVNTDEQPIIEETPAPKSPKKVEGSMIALDDPNSI